MNRCSRRTRVKSCMKNSAQKNYSHDALLRRLARKKPKNSSRVCLHLSCPPSAQYYSLSRSRIVNFTLTSSEYSSSQDLDTVSYRYNFRLLCIPTNFLYITPYHRPFPEFTFITSLSLPCPPIPKPILPTATSYYRCFHLIAVFIWRH